MSSVSTDDGSGVRFRRKSAIEVPAKLYGEPNAVVPIVGCGLRPQVSNRDIGEAGTGSMGVCVQEILNQ